MTLTEFILERIAEDEAEAHRRVQFGEGVVSSAPRVNPSPARVLAECEAKRRIVQEHASKRGKGHDCVVCVDDMCHPRPSEWMPVPYPCPTLRILAAVYASHPDFDPSWRPD